MSDKKIIIENWVNKCICENIRKIQNMYSLNKSYNNMMFQENVLHIKNIEKFVYVVVKFSYEALLIEQVVFAKMRNMKKVSRVNFG